MYWAQALAEQDADRDLQATFAPIAKQLADNEQTIVDELNNAQGKPAETGGYYRPDRELTAKVMRPSGTLNAVIDAMQGTVPGL
jgi:isocitrate dehydrogenase